MVNFALLELNIILSPIRLTNKYQLFIQKQNRRIIFTLMCEFQSSYYDGIL